MKKERPGLGTLWLVILFVALLLSLNIAFVAIAMSNPATDVDSSSEQNKSQPVTGELFKSTEESEEWPELCGSAEATRADSGADSADQAYAQLLSLGLVWVSLHCVGMCGTLLVGFDLGGSGRGVSVRRSAQAVLSYQLGRGLVYALFGALAGSIGAGLEASFSGAGSVLTLVLAAIVLVRVIVPDGGDRPKVTFGRRSKTASVLGRVQRTLIPSAGNDGFSNHLAFGAVMAFLPCMLTMWVMALAATTGSPFHGALLMVLLVVLTTPVLLGVVVAPNLMGNRVRAGFNKARNGLLALSGSWLVLVGLAGLGLIEHAHLDLDIANSGAVVMLW